MPTISAFRMDDLYGLDEVVNAFVAPTERWHPVQAGTVVGVSPYAANWLILLLLALDFPLLPSRGQGVLAYEDDNPVGSPDTRANALLPILVVGFLNRHVDKFEWRPWVKRLPLEQISLVFVLNSEGDKDHLFVSH